MKPKDLFAKAREEGRTYLNEIESKDILDSIGVENANAVLATSKTEAQAAGKKMGYPVVLKVVSQDIVHKSDVGGVELNLGSSTGVGKSILCIIR